MIPDVTPDSLEDCEHDQVDENVCVKCGLVFVYCHECSLFSHSAVPQYHAEPICSSSKTKGE